MRQHHRTLTLNHLHLPGTSSASACSESSRGVGPVLATAAPARGRASDSSGGVQGTRAGAGPASASEAEATGVGAFWATERLQHAPPFPFLSLVLLLQPLESFAVSLV